MIYNGATLQPGDVIVKADGTMTFLSVDQNAVVAQPETDGQKLGRLSKELEDERKRSDGLKTTANTYSAQIQDLRNEITRFVKWGQDLGAVPTLPGYVLRVRKAGETPKALLSVGGKEIEVPVTAFPDLKPGSVVNVDAQSFGIVEHVTETTGAAGEIVTVTDVLATGEVEITHNGTPRAVICPDATREGDRVVLDKSGTIVLRNLGRAKNDFAVGAESLYDSRLGLYRIQKQSSVGAGKLLTFGHIASGAQIAGVVERATSFAMSSEHDIAEQDIRAAVADAFQEAQDVNHQNEIAEFTDGWAHEVTNVSKLKPARSAA